VRTMLVFHPLGHLSDSFAILNFVTLGSGHI
jgi:hypothetical protein